jgi:hypothetical protein
MAVDLSEDAQRKSERESDFWENVYGGHWYALFPFAINSVQNRTEICSLCTDNRLMFKTQGRENNGQGLLWVGGFGLRSG